MIFYFNKYTHTYCYFLFQLSIFLSAKNLCKCFVCPLSVCTKYIYVWSSHLPLSQFSLNSSSILYFLRKMLFWGARTMQFSFKNLIAWKNLAKYRIIEGCHMVHLIKVFYAIVIQKLNGNLVSHSPLPPSQQRQD